MITTLTGENDFLRLFHLRQIIDEFVAEFTDMAVERLDGEETSYDRMHEAAQSLPFLVPRKLVVLRSPGANKEFIEKFDAFLDDIAETNDIVIIEPKLDKRLTYFKSLKKNTDFKEFHSLDANGLARFLADHAKQHGGNLSIKDASALMDRVGTNQQILINEVEKLILYEPTVTRESIDLLTEKTPQSTIFELLEAAFSGRREQAIRLYQEQRALKVEPQQIIAMLVWQLYILALIKSAGNRSTDDIAREAKLSPYVVRKSTELTRHITLARVRELIDSLRIFDVRLKTESINADEVVQYYLLGLAV